MTENQKMLIAVTIVIVITGSGQGLGLVSAYAWPEGTTEAQKDKILTVTSDDQLTVEESGIAGDRVYEIFDAYDPDSQEYKDLIDCGFVDKLAFEILQCWEDKGHTVR